MIDFTKTFQLKGLNPKNKGHTNFYECCDLTKKVYLIYIKTQRIKVLKRSTKARLELKNSSKIYQLKGLKPKNKGHTNFYECCDLTEKVTTSKARRSEARDTREIRYTFSIKSQHS